MTDREKMIETMNAAEMERCFVTSCGSCKHKDEGCCLLGLYADALIEAGFGNEKELRIELRSKVDYIHEQDDIIGHYKHRAEVVERAFDNTIKAFHETLSALFPGTKIDLDEWKKKNLANAEKELAEEGKDG